MEFMASGGEIQGIENTSPWMDREHSSFTSLNGTKNTNWYNAAVQMSVSEDSIIKETGRFKTPVE